jgi:hypothetical protein
MDTGLAPTMSFLRVGGTSRLFERSIFKMGDFPDYHQFMGPDKSQFLKILTV